MLPSLVDSLILYNYLVANPRLRMTREVTVAEFDLDHVTVAELENGNISVHMPNCDGYRYLVLSKEGYVSGTHGSYTLVEQLVHYYLSR